MKVSQQCLAMIRHHEGIKLRPYRCPALLWTCLVGHVCDPNHARIPLEQRKSLPIPEGWNRQFTMEEADAVLSKDLERFIRGVSKYCPSPITQGQLDALVSFSFNLGLGTLQRSTLRQKHNRGDYEGAANEFLKFTKAGGKVLRGLVTRRGDERSLYLAK
jgi:lysozyme